MSSPSDLQGTLKKNSILTKIVLLIAVELIQLVLNVIVLCGAPATSRAFGVPLNEVTKLKW